MTRTMTSMLLAVSCLFADGVFAQGVQKHPQPTTTAFRTSTIWRPFSR